MVRRSRQRVGSRAATASCRWSFVDAPAATVSSMTWNLLFAAGNAAASEQWGHVREAVQRYRSQSAIGSAVVTRTSSGKADCLKLADNRFESLRLLKWSELKFPCIHGVPLPAKFAARRPKSSPVAPST